MAVIRSFPVILPTTWISLYETEIQMVILRCLAYRKVASASTSRLVTCLGLQHPKTLDFLYSNMSRLVAPHVTNRIEIHAKKTYEIQRRMLKSKQRRILKSMQRRLLKSMLYQRFTNLRFTNLKFTNLRFTNLRFTTNPSKEAYEIQAKKDLKSKQRRILISIHANKYPLGHVTN